MVVVACRMRCRRILLLDAAMGWWHWAANGLLCPSPVLALKSAPLRRRRFLGRPALRGPGRTSSGACGPPGRLRFFASLESGYPGVVLA